MHSFIKGADCRHGMAAMMFGGRGHRGGWGGGWDRGWGGSPFGGGFPGDGGRGGRGHGGRGRRMFEGSELRLILLHLLAEQPRHGYDLIREIEARSNGAYAPSPGVVYPTLTMLADMGLIAEADTGGARKTYAITAEGEAELAQSAATVAALVERLGQLGEAQARNDAGPVRRALGNLRTVLHERLHRDDSDTETQHAIAEILDDAARRIERLDG